MDVDPGYGTEPWLTLAREVPGEDVYPPDDFRTEWGAVLHRGRLDGSAHVVVLGQDPAAQEAVVRRILVGLAGQRVQGLLGKLGVTRSYAMVNVFAYSVASQSRGARHSDDPAIRAYRERWLDALVAGGQVRVLLAFGSLAQEAADRWCSERRVPGLTVRALLHPTYPESAAAAGDIPLPDAMRRLCRQWNAALEPLRAALPDPDEAADLTPYGDALTDADLRPIPRGDLPPGLPDWMATGVRWAERAGTTADERRATLLVRVPAEARHWSR